MADAPVYGCAMRQAIAGGDVGEMRAMVDQAKEHLREFGNVPLLLEMLKTEIARAEKGERSD